jgi:GTP cyclohydrolase II
MIQFAQDNSIRRVVSTRLPTKWGEFRVLGFEREIPYHVGLRPGRVETALAIVMGDLNDVVEAPLVRIHSQCFTGESLGSVRAPGCRLGYR